MLQKLEGALDVNNCLEVEGSVTRGKRVVEEDKDDVTEDKEVRRPSKRARRGRNETKTQSTLTTWLNKTQPSDDKLDDDMYLWLEFYLGAKSRIRHVKSLTLSTPDQSTPESESDQEMSSGVTQDCDKSVTVEEDMVKTSKIVTSRQAAINNPIVTREYDADKVMTSRHTVMTSRHTAKQAQMMTRDDDASPIEMVDTATTATDT